MNNTTVKVKLFGESIKIHSLKISNEDLELFEKVASQLNEPLNKALLDPYFYKKLDIRTIRSIKNLSVKNLGGLINNNQSQIEIWYNQKRKAKFSVNQLLSRETLFPLYQTEYKQTDLLKLPQGYYWEERELGLIGQYEFQASNFQIDLMKFNLGSLLIHSELIEFLNTIKYDHQKIKKIKTNAVLKYQWCFYNP